MPILVQTGRVIDTGIALPEKSKEMYMNSKAYRAFCGEKIDIPLERRNLIVIRKLFAVNSREIENSV